MAISQPGATDILNSPDHSLLHRIIAADVVAAVKSLVVDVNGNIGVATETFGTSAAKVVAIANGTAPSTSPADCIQLYAEHVVTDTNVITGGTATADTEFAGMPATNGSDNDIDTLWLSTDTAFDHWWKYDLGAAVTKIVTKLRIAVHKDVGGQSSKNFVLSGSNNDSAYTTVYTGLLADGTTKTYQDFTFSNAVAYRYYKLTFSDNYRADSYVGFYEVQMMESFVELKVRDEAGNITVLSPHTFKLFKKPHPLAWSYYSEKGNYIINVDMFGFVKAVEELSGKKLIYLN